MSEHMRKHHTSSENNSIIHFFYNNVEYFIPQSVAKKYAVKRDNKKSLNDSVSSEQVFAGLVEQYTKPGVLLKGLRAREGLSQITMAERLDLTQANLSKMENGKRRIGRILAQRIAKEFGINYRSLLS